MLVESAHAAPNLVVINQVAGKEAADYETYMNNVVTVLSRSTHMLAVPPCKLLNPRVR